MKKFSFVIFSILLITAISIHADEDKWDAIHLKNGFVVEGDIVELVVNEYVKIKLITGIVNTYQMSDIIKIEKVPRPRPKKPETPLKKINPNPQQVQQLKGIGQQLDSGQTKTQYNYTMKFSDLPGYKSPSTAFLLSFFVTGAGQFYNGDVGKGVVQIGMVVAGLGLLLSESGNRNRYYDDGFSSTDFGGLALILGGAVWSAIDAPISASKKNKKLMNGDEFGHLLEFESGQQIVGVDMGFDGKSLGGKVTLHF